MSKYALLTKCEVKMAWILAKLFFLQKKSEANIQPDYMATIVRTLWLAAERALFSCNDRALWNFFSAWRFFWVVSKTTYAWAKTTEKMDKGQLYFQ